MKSVFAGYLQLTKPSIMLLVIFTGSAALFVEGSLVGQPLKFALVLLGLFLTGGCANALNQYFEREIDSQMGRTVKRRPLPTGKIEPRAALIFSISIGVVGVLIFGFFFNWLTAALATATILFYSLFYTLWLKPHTAQNIVWGGIAGAMAPVGAWAAATGSTDLTPWIMFAIIFLWTPPHFWALALFCSDDYKRVNLPMMPVVKGERSTLNQMLVYTFILFAVSMALLLFEPGWIYTIAALGLGGWFIYKIVDARKDASQARLRSVFGHSILYLFGLFAAIIIESLV